MMTFITLQSRVRLAMAGTGLFVSHMITEKHTGEAFVLRAVAATNSIERLILFLSIKILMAMDAAVETGVQ